MNGTTDRLANVEDLSEQQLRDFAAALTADQARILIEAIGVVDMSGIARILGVAYHRVKMLRRKTSPTGDGPRPDELPEALPLPGGSPVYLRREVVTWARQTGRLDGDGNPIRLRPVGRPPKTGRRRDDAGRFTS